MTAAGDGAGRRARRLLRWYPASWRARYGDEFAELLAAEMTEQPRSARRTADVIASGLLARCTVAGLTSHELAPADRARAGMTTLGCALAAFLALGVAMLAQLATGWQWAAAVSPADVFGTLVMTIAGASLALLALAAAVPVGWRTGRSVARRDARIARPAGLALISAAALVAGARHFQNAWPGTGGTGAQHGLVPGGLSAFGWASTLSVSSYWAHPALLGRFPHAELAWMALSPVAAAGLLTGLVLTVRRLTWPVRLLRYEAALAGWACLSAAVFLAGAVSWMLGHGGTGLFRPGLVNGAELLIMALSLAVALLAAARVRHARDPRAAAA
jgi:hypothetical protein